MCLPSGWEMGRGVVTGLNPSGIPAFFYYLTTDRRVVFPESERNI